MKRYIECVRNKGLIRGTAIFFWMRRYRKERERVVTNYLKGAKTNSGKFLKM